MSILDLPRLYFFGSSQWNPNTVNNSPAIYDESTAQPVPQPGVTFDGFVQWLTELNAAGNSPNGSWNVYGDHACSFVNAAITGVSVESADCVSDALTGAAVQLLGDSRGKNSTPARLVDLDPYGATTSQVFYKTFSVGSPECGFVATGACRMFSRWPNFGRNLQRLPIAGSMGVIWQTAARSCDIEWFGLSLSPALAKLKEAAESAGNQGVSLLFSSYRTLYYQNASYKGQPIKNGADLAAAYSGGFEGGNPASSILLGTIGVWGCGELASGPVQRLLAPATPVAPVTQTMDRRRAVQEGLITAAPVSSPVSLGPAIAEVDAKRYVVTVSFLATFPEKNRELEKADFGTFLLEVQDSAGGKKQIGSPLTAAGYSRQSWQATAGIYEFPFDPSLAGKIAQGQLVLTQQSTGNTALAETVLIAETDQRGCYVNQSDSGKILIHVFERGQAPAGTVKVLIAQYDNLGNLIQDPTASLVRVTPAGGIADVIDGIATIEVHPLQPGVCSLGFFPFTSAKPPTPPTQGFPGVTDFYAVVRTLPFDDVFKDHPPDESLTWSFLYATTLRNYDVVYPIMSTIFNLHDQNAIAANAAAIRSAISPAAFESTLAMPITRELSAGKQVLLQRYLDRVLGAKGATA